MRKADDLFMTDRRFCTGTVTRPGRVVGAWREHGCLRAALNGRTKCAYHARCKHVDEREIQRTPGTYGRGSSHRYSTYYERTRCGKRTTGDDSLYCAEHTALHTDEEE